jgi:uncharacterized protein (UPF0261 family)
MILDSGIRGTPTCPADIARSEVAAAAGTTLDALAELDRGEAVEAMAEGVESVVSDLVARGQIAGCLCIGGAGVVIAVRAFDKLEAGFPRLIVTPLASGSRPFEMLLGTGDVTVMHSVADIMGINRITSSVLTTAAGMIAGAVHARARNGNVESNRPAIAASMNGNTTPALTEAAGRVAAAGYELIAFHANGVGGRAMESLIESGAVSGVLDYTTTELGSHEYDGLMDAGPDRMEAAGNLGIPQALIPGSLDLITVGPYEAAAARFPDRRLYRHNPALTLVRLDRDEMARLGEVFAAKASASRGPVSVWIPMRGFSMVDHEGGPFWDPAANEAFVAALEARVDPRVRVNKLDAHVNESNFVKAVLDGLLQDLESTQRSSAEVLTHE